MWLSTWGPFTPTLTSDCTLSLLRVGGADVTVQVIGLKAGSTTA
jgi:hypothetical protein